MYCYGDIAKVRIYSLPIFMVDFIGIALFLNLGVCPF
jgi:hypothetical protein